MDLRVNHDELDNFYDLSRNESEFLREEIDVWLEKIEELKTIWQGEDADEFYENVRNYFERMHILPEFYDSVNDFVIGANKEYRNTDLESRDEIQKVVKEEDQYV